MATYQQTIRRGLPRVAGGPGWPDVEGAVVASGAPVGQSVQDPVASHAPAAVSEAGASVALRRGLPRVSGGEPWPPAGEVAGVTVPGLRVAAEAAGAPVIAGVDSPSSAQAATAETGNVSTPVGNTTAETVSEEVTLRRGLPRVAGGDPWPSASTATVQRAVALQQSEPAQETVPTAPSAPATALPAKTEAPAARPAPASTPKPQREPRMIGSRPLLQWIKFGAWGVIGAILAAGIIVLAARGITTLPGVPEFLKEYPGEYHIPVVVEPGFPAWARWTHFLNIFLMVLIIRSGLQVRQQQKPPAFWTPKKGGKKISINLWLHTSLDVLWILNGIVFIVLLFVSGHWARIVPTSWEVFPNAASALLQYLTLEWPLENGWVNYNSLQQIMYFLVVFIAAPLAIITGLRMSEWWPQKAERLNKIYPAPLARAIHFPTMLFFVLFILIHVFLVFTTGALRNLNHMFAGTDDVNWVGFWWFAAGLFVTVAAVFLARPLILAPIASLTGKVSNR
ncbi:hypothetical protein G7066_12915 [Leucobacter coleopterorum]|uniref:Cytochrome b561 bacterial/Ni-hydrogenase domain-containing protein n=1 Tax=Leucobacter coleopterorum TaxID=2714933 RepID=A0ABX6JY64_9MICO|nr:cytochrome b/b6 domain-containing protein [Leucobacter coleopterorum]QIM19241.1 hypothetical protein G7066_12915 [Leucobacter coleopterorum]